MKSGYHVVLDSRSRASGGEGSSNTTIDFINLEAYVAFKGTSWGTCFHMEGTAWYSFWCL